MKQYLELLKDILDNGEERTDRTSVGTISLFARQLKFDLRKGFPAITTKKLAWKAVVGELLWFIEGSSSERRLAEITHGTAEGTVTIWTPNALAPYWKDKAQFKGDLGRIYGVQWRHWRSHIPEGEPDIDDDYGKTWFDPIYKEIDQLSILIEGIKKDPNSRRHILTAWNPGELDRWLCLRVMCYVNSMSIKIKNYLAICTSVVWMLFLAYLLTLLAMRYSLI